MTAKRMEHRGISLDGLRFALGESPVIAPAADVAYAYDSGGCEDPTVALVDGVYYVYYTGWNGHSWHLSAAR